MFCQKRNPNKKPGFRQVLKPVFINASELSPSPSVSQDTNISSEEVPNDLQEKLNFYRNKAKVPNTERSTKNWVIRFEEFRKKYNYNEQLEEITDFKIIEKQVCEYVAQMSKKKNSGEYKAKTVKQAVDAINRYLVHISPIRGINLHDKYEFPDLNIVLHGKMKELQEKGFGEKEGSVALNVQQVQEILADDFLNPNTPEGLLYHVFFQIATCFACCGREHYNLRVDQFLSLPDGSLIFRRYRSKNNQRGIEGGDAQDIRLPSGSDAINDINKYLSKRPADASESFYLQINLQWRETNIWYKKSHCGSNRVGNFMKDIGKSVKVNLPSGLLTNHSGRKTAAQILQDADVPEDAIMGVTGHKSVQGIRAYKVVNEKQQLAAMKTLINTINPSGSSDSANNSDVFSDNLNKEEQLNNNLPEIPTIQKVNEEQNAIDTTFSDRKFPIFNSCHFNNVTFKF